VFVGRHGNMEIRAVYRMYSGRSHTHCADSRSGSLRGPCQLTNQESVMSTRPLEDYSIPRPRRWYRRSRDGRYRSSREPTGNRPCLRDSNDPSKLPVRTALIGLAPRSVPPSLNGADEWFWIFRDFFGCVSQLETDFASEACMSPSGRSAKISGRILRLGRDCDGQTGLDQFAEERHSNQDIFSCF
jgi:hypothetical protein